MGNGVMAIGPKLPRPFLTLPSDKFRVASKTVSYGAYKRPAGRGMGASIPCL
jgi:hypothetical protein